MRFKSSFLTIYILELRVASEVIKEIATSCLGHGWVSL